MKFEKYNESWSDVIRPDILKRDNYKCQECGVVHKKYVMRNGNGQYLYISKEEFEEYNKSGHKCYRIYLQVAHLDSNRTNNDYSNLKTLCLWCHLKYDKDYKRLLRLSKKKDNTTLIYSTRAIPVQVPAPAPLAQMPKTRH